MSDKTYWTIAEPAASAREQVPLGQPADTRPIFVPREQVIRTPKCGARGQLSNSNGTLYTAPSASSPTGATQGALLKSIVLCNTDTANRTVTLYAVESGGSAAANRAVLSAAIIGPGVTITIAFADDEFPLDSGETIQGLADSASKVTYRINVVELT